MPKPRVALASLRCNRSNHALYTLIIGMTHPMTPGHGASWVGHLPPNWWLRGPSWKPLVRHYMDNGVRQCQSLYLGASCRYTSAATMATVSYRPWTWWKFNRNYIE